MTCKASSINSKPTFIEIDVNKTPVSPLDSALVDSEIQAIFKELGKTAAWSLYTGPHLETLANSLRSRFERVHAQLCCSGTFAIELALRGCRIEAGDEVLLAAYDFPGNFRAIEAVGASVAIVDIPANTWSLNDIEPLDQAIGPKTKAIIVSHLHGTTASMATICQWAHDRQLHIIEDACQAPGAVMQGKPAGYWGDVSVFSFGGSKLLSSGRGGAILTNDARIDQRMRVYRDRGNDAFAMSELQAAVLGPQWKKLDARHVQRADAVTAIEKSISSFHWLACPIRRESISQCAFYKWGFRVQPQKSSAIELRDAVVRTLNQRGILAGAGFHGFGNRSNARCRRAGSLLNAEQAAQTTVLIHHTMLTQTLPDLLMELDRQLRNENIID